MTQLSGVGLASYGIALPQYAIPTTALAEAYRKDTSSIQALGIKQKAVPDLFEDTLTLAHTASLRAIQASQIEPQAIQSSYVGSETHPFAVNPTSSYLKEFLKLNNNCFCADIEFACKGGTAALQNTVALISGGLIEQGLSAGSDCGKGAPTDALDYCAGAGAATFIATNDQQKTIANIKHMSSHTSNHPDFWRAENQKYPAHGGRFSSYAYNDTLLSAISSALKLTNLAISDFNHVVLHAPNWKLPSRLAQKIGITPEQIQHSQVVQSIGNTYAANSLISLANVLDKAKPQEKILVASYGSGSGSDVFVIETTSQINSYQPVITVEQAITKLITINFSDYHRLTHGHEE